jgi:hypothetical protein
MVAAMAVLAAALMGATQGDPVALAQKKFEEAQSQGLDLSRGPCLGELKPGWVADIAHSPRQPIDDLPVNQCADYLSGKAKHFVELDPHGQVIRVR